MNLLEPYHQTYSYDTGNNLTHLSHQADSSTWQQTLTIHPNNNRGTETQLLCSVIFICFGKLGKAVVAEPMESANVVKG
jgi:hypothetical protein